MRGRVDEPEETWRTSQRCIERLPGRRANHGAPYLVGGLIPVLRTIGRPGAWVWLYSAHAVVVALTD